MVRHDVWHLPDDESELGVAGRWFKQKWRQCRHEADDGQCSYRCTREREHSGPHANAWWQYAWVTKTCGTCDGLGRVAEDVKYVYPYELMEK